jgi:hypothetical protein
VIQDDSQWVGRPCTLNLIREHVLLMTNSGARQGRIKEIMMSRFRVRLYYLGRDSSLVFSSIVQHRQGYVVEFQNKTTAAISSLPGVCYCLTRVYGRYYFQLPPSDTGCRNTHKTTSELKPTFSLESSGHSGLQQGRRPICRVLNPSLTQRKGSVSDSQSPPRRGRPGFGNPDLQTSGAKPMCSIT